MEINIRKVNIDDVNAIVFLSKELGYEPQRGEIENKIRKFEFSLDEEIFVAEFEKVIGWMHISLVEPLESNPFVEIRGIVVTQEYRKKGIGTKLIKTAEDWAKEKSCKKIRVRTNVKREETRKYYRNLNFISKKYNVPQKLDKKIA
jgi:N-acetylglutamate synthase-like GNAT family acetyltransferase